MTRHNFTQADWNHLLDGEVHLIDLDLIGFEGGLASFRALAHYQASKRYGVAKTRKLDNISLSIQGLGCRQLGAPARPTPWLPAPQEQPPKVDRFARDLPPSPSALSPTDETLDEVMTPEEEEALLGPCSCGQSPTCLPTCARFS